MAVYTHCCRAQPLRQLGFLVLYVTVVVTVICIQHDPDWEAKLDRQTEVLLHEVCPTTLVT